MLLHSELGASQAVAGGERRAWQGHRLASASLLAPTEATKIAADAFSTPWLLGTAPADRRALWRARALCAMAIAVSGTQRTAAALCSLTPREVAGLLLPERAWRHVATWLGNRRRFLGTLEGPWAALPPLSNGRPHMIRWALVSTAARLGWRCPGWKGYLRCRWTEPLVPCPPRYAKDILGPAYSQDCPK